MARKPTRPAAAGPRRPLPAAPVLAPKGAPSLLTRLAGK